MSTNLSYRLDEEKTKIIVCRCNELYALASAEMRSQTIEKNFIIASCPIFGRMLHAVKNFVMILETLTCTKFQLYRVKEC